MSDVTDNDEEQKIYWSTRVQVHVGPPMRIIVYRNLWIELPTKTGQGVANVKLFFFGILSRIRYFAPAEQPDNSPEF